MCWSTETWKKMIWLEDRDSTALKYLNIHLWNIIRKKKSVIHGYFLQAISFLWCYFSFKLASM